MGLGDFTEKVIHAVVPKTIIKAVQEQDGGCGCNKRKEALNTLSYNLSKALSLESKQETMDEDLTLAELREKYPEISARSKSDFLKKIELLEDAEENIADSFSSEEVLDLDAPFITHSTLEEYIRTVMLTRKKILIQCINSIEADAIFRKLTDEVFQKLGVSVAINTSRRDISMNGSCYMRFVCQTNHDLVKRTFNFTDLKDLV